MFAKFSQNLENDSKILQHRIEYAREDCDWNVVNMYFVAVDQRRQLRKMEKNCAAEDDF